MQKLDNYEEELKKWSKNEEASAHLLGEWLYNMFRPEFVIDIGCGSGIFLKPFALLGCDVFGVDGEKTGGAALEHKHQFEQRDLRLKQDLGTHDLAICLEVIEHLQPEYEDILIDNVARSANTIVFSGAKPGQVGTNHYNCQPKEYWIGKFNDRGFKLLGQPTKAIIEFMESKDEFRKTPWLEENIFIVGKS